MRESATAMFHTNKTPAILPTRQIFTAASSKRIAYINKSRLAQRAQHVGRRIFEDVSQCGSVSDTGQQLLSLSQENATDLYRVARIPQHSPRLSGGNTEIQSKT